MTRIISKDSAYIKLVRKYQNKWIALNKEKTKVYASASNISSLEKQIEKINEPLVMKRVLPTY